MCAVSESIKIHLTPSLPYPAEEEVSNISEGCDGVTRAKRLIKFSVRFIAKVSTPGGL